MSWRRVVRASGGIVVIAALFGGCGRATNNSGSMAAGGNGNGNGNVSGAGTSSGGSTSVGGFGATSSIAGNTQTGGGGNQSGSANGGGGDRGVAGSNETPCGSATDVHNCGSCGNDCTTLPFVKPQGMSCVDGQCNYADDACLPGFARCDPELEGCSFDLTRPATCGDCNTHCQFTLCASPTPDGAICVSKCPANLTECDQQCVDLASNSHHCGACETSCVQGNTFGICENGQCVNAGCLRGSAHCSATEPWCETVLGTFDNCARCGDSCDDAPHAVGRCQDAHCHYECDTGFADCDAAAAGCETPLNTAHDCGACGKTCSGDRALCSDGECVAACPAALPNECDGACVDLQTDVRHCGVCATSCEAYQGCEDGACTPHYVSTTLIEGSELMPRTVALTADGAVVLAMSFNGTADFDPGPGKDQRTSQSQDMAIEKLNADGSQAWTRVLGGADYDEAGELALTPSGAVLASLVFRGTVDLDPSASVDSHTAIGNTGAIVRLEADGSFAWARSFPANGDPVAAISWLGALATDAAGALYATGQFRGALQLEPGKPAVATADQLTTFMLKLTPDGALAWSHVFIGCDLTLGAPLVDANNELWLGGSLTGTCRVDPGNVGSDLVGSLNLSGVLTRWNALTGAYVSGSVDGELGNIFESALVGNNAGYFGGGFAKGSFVIKTDPLGTKAWTWQGPDIDLAGIAAVAKNGLLIGGQARRTAGPLPEGTFIAKLAPASSDPRWSFVVPSRDSSVTGIDANGTQFVIAGTSGSGTDFDPGKSVESSPTDGVFISRYTF